jgi:hypothetical protein
MVSFLFFITKYNIYKCVFLILLIHANLELTQNGTSPVINEKKPLATSLVKTLMFKEVEISPLRKFDKLHNAQQNNYDGITDSATVYIINSARFQKRQSLGLIFGDSILVTIPKNGYAKIKISLGNHKYRLTIIDWIVQFMQIRTKNSTALPHLNDFQDWFKLHPKVIAKFNGDDGNLIIETRTDGWNYLYNSKGSSYIYNCGGQVGFLIAKKTNNDPVYSGKIDLHLKVETAKDYYLEAGKRGFIKLISEAEGKALLEKRMESNFRFRTHCKNIGDKLIKVDDLNSNSNIDDFFYFDCHLEPIEGVKLLSCPVTKDYLDKLKKIF